MLDNIEENQVTGLEIAVIGMACRLPGAKNLDEFWHNLEKGIESISFFSGEELEEEGLDAALIKHPKYVKAKAVLEDIEYFDAAFFGYSTREASMLDPQFRFFHECSWEALENAGYTPDSYDGLIGVYSGAAANISWLARNINRAGDPSEKFELSNLNDRDYLSTLISYKLNLKGPGITVQTACSTSLVAVHLACQGLIGQDCDMAAAGGVSISLPKKSGYVYQEGLVHSPDGHCRAFDTEAKGTVAGDGTGVVILKRLEDALKDNDNIRAVIKGSAVNNDGSRKVDFTAPSIKGQAEAIQTAYLLAETKPGSIGYIETHGTGTPLGDPIEIEALTRVFDTDKKGFCAVGSIKSNIGHLITAAGIAGFIKTVLALEHKLIPPSLHFQTPNPKIDFENTPFYVNRKLSPWKNNHYPLRASVSSFGIGGTNAHVILEEPPRDRKEMPAPSREYKLILLSARGKSSLDKMKENLLEYLKQDPKVDLADAAYTLQVGRGNFQYRAQFVCTDAGDAVKALSAPDAARLWESRAENFNRPVVFMFPGQGSQYVNMGLDLYREEPGFKEEIDECFDILTPIAGYDMRKILYPGETPATTLQQDINQTGMAQPVLFIFEYVLAKLLIKWGIEPYAMIGHSLGEYVAAALSGVFSMEDALRLVALRGKLMQGLPPGSMLDVPLPAEEIAPFLNSELSLAAVNGPSHCVVSGTRQAAAAFEKQLKEQGYLCKPLHTSHAFHSQMMEPILKEFQEQLNQIERQEPEIPFISNTTGQWLTAEQALSPGYWSMHLRNTVLFSPGLKELLTKEQSVFIEVGPGKILSTFARQHLNDKDKHFVINLLRHPNDKTADDYFLSKQIGQLWLQGINLDWQEFSAHEERRRIPLPGYPFDSRYYWIKGDSIIAEAGRFGEETSLPKKKDISDWFYIPSWKPTVFPSGHTGTAPGQSGWLLFIDECGLGSRFEKDLGKHRQDVITVTAGPGFRPVKDRQYEINPRSKTDYDKLFAQLHSQNSLPRRIVHLWGITGETPGELSLEQVEKGQDSGFYSLTYLIQAMNNYDTGKEVQISVITNYMQEVSDGELTYPWKSTVLGPVRVIPLEYPKINCRSIDIPFPFRDDIQGEKLIRRLWDDLWVTDFDSSIVAYRGNRRLIQAFAPVRLEKPGKTPRLKQKGTYLVTGGTGGIGLVLAKYLAQTLQANLILTASSPFPPGSQWADWLEKHDHDDPTSLKIKKIQEIRDCGAEVLIYRADVSDKKQMAGVVSDAEKHLAPINGVIHAAGIADGTLMQRRTREMSEKIFAPKIKGTLVLDSIFREADLDFFILCSSLVAVDAQVGQLAYCAANAFLDAYAQYKCNTGRIFTVSVNWDAWREVGMAVKAAQQLNARIKPLKTRPQQIHHHLFSGYLPAESGRETYISFFNLNKYWVLQEHKFGTKGVIPGTFFLEMIYSAIEKHARANPIVIKEIYFLSPLVIHEQETKEVHTILEKQDNRFEFFIASQSTEKKWQEHARGKIQYLELAQPPTHDMEEMAARCPRQGTGHTNKNQQTNADSLTFGPRWNNLREVKLGEKQGLARLEIPGAYRKDLELYKLHPALLDIATSFLAAEFKNQREYLPFSYKNLKIYRSLNGTISSYAKLIDSNQVNQETIKFNIIIMNEEGMELVNIEEFTLKAVSKDKMIKQGEIDSPGTTTDAGASAFKEEYGSGILAGGIGPAEGAAVFQRILGSHQPRFLISTVDFTRRIQRKHSPGSRETLEKLQEFSGAARKQARPELSVEYAAPVTETGKKLANILQDFLGYRQVGIHDDFFELDGDSLKAISVIGKIYKEFNVEITIADFFNKPTIEGIHQLINHSKKSSFYSIKPIEKKEYYHLSSAQKRLFILDRFENIGISYNMPFFYQFKGELDKEKFAEIIRRLIHRHESLRTSFGFINRQPVQVIHKNRDFQVEDIPREHGDIELTISKFIKPFDLSKGPVFRAGICLLSGNEYLFLFDIHHIIADGSSISIIVMEFEKLYSGESLPPLKIQYKDYTAWQNDLFAKGKIKQQEDYWLNIFQGDIPRVNLPTDFPRPKIKTFRGSSFNFQIETEDTGNLKRLCGELGVTVYMTLLAAFNILLLKYTRQQDIIVGSNFAGRAHADLHEVVGMFVNLLPMRHYPGSEKTFLEFLYEVKEGSLKSFENQDIQFETLIDRLHIERDPSKNPLLDILFNIQNFGESGKDDYSNPIDYSSDTSKFDITIFINERKNHIDCSIEYSTDLFNRSTIEKLGQHYIEILKQVVKDRDIKLKNIQISHQFLTTTSNIENLDFKL